MRSPLVQKRHGYSPAGEFLVLAPSRLPRQKSNRRAFTKNRPSPNPPPALESGQKDNVQDFLRGEQRFSETKGSLTSFTRPTFGLTKVRRAHAGDGFTLVEILVVVGLFGLLVAVGALIGLDSIGRGNVSSERDTLVTLLTGARTAALANVHAKPHGVYVDSTHFTAFEGTSFAAGSNKREVGRDANIAITPDPAEVVFGQLRANIASPVSITLSNGANSQVIDINTEGRIEW